VPLRAALALLALAARLLFASCLAWAGPAAAAEPAATAALSNAYASADRSRFAEATQAIQQGELEAARNTLLALQSRYPKSPEIMNNLAVIADRSGNPALAAQLFEQAAKTAPYYLSIYNNALRQPAGANAGKPASFQLVDALPPALRLPTFAQPTPGPAPDTQVARLALLLPALESALEQWRQDWQAHRIQAYLAWYADDFRPTPAALSRAEWKAQRQALFAKTQQESSVTIRYLQIAKVSPLDADSAQALLVFEQRYRASQHADLGLKTMRWRWKNGQWRILSERFRACRAPQDPDAPGCRPSGRD
jgi:ketosteroid isomerase-like protein